MQSPLQNMPGTGEPASPLPPPSSQPTFAPPAAPPEAAPDECAVAPEERAAARQRAPIEARAPAERPAGEASPQPFLQRPLGRALLIGGALALVIAGGAYWLYARNYVDTDDAFIDGHTVQIAAKVAGYVDKLCVTDNQLIQQGDLLLEIDARDYRVSLDEARAADAASRGRMAQAEAQLKVAEAQLLGAKADALAAKATAENAEIDLERNQKLAPRGAVSQQSLDSATALAHSTAAQLAAATARAAMAEAQITLARSQQVTAAAEAQESQARIRAAELNLSYVRVIAPITGRVTHRTVELGDYLTVGQPLLALVDPNVWVTANFKETQLTHMQVGLPVNVAVDAYPGRPLKAHVDSFQRGSGARFSLLPAENATGNYVKVVQRVPVKIVFDEAPPGDMILGPGMSVVPTVTIR